MMAEGQTPRREDMGERGGVGGQAKGKAVRSGIRTHASRGDCDLNAAP